MSNLEKRIADLEQRAGMDDEQHIIIIRWGPDDESKPEVLSCQETGQKWAQGAGESRETFMARVKADLPNTDNILLFAS